jgi:hypothetical protein
MDMQYDDTMIGTQALLELTDANVSPDEEGAWDAAVANARHETDESVSVEGFDAVIDAALAFG